jgi:hypothetical protein
MKAGNVQALTQLQPSKRTNDKMPDVTNPTSREIV